jgi:hypothetical protein
MIQTGRLKVSTESDTRCCVVDRNAALQEHADDLAQPSAHQYTTNEPGSCKPNSTLSAFA